MPQRLAKPLAVLGVAAYFVGLILWGGSIGILGSCAKYNPEPWCKNLAKLW